LSERERDVERSVCVCVCHQWTCSADEDAAARCGVAQCRVAVGEAEAVHVEEGSSLNHHGRHTEEGGRGIACQTKEAARDREIVKREREREISQRERERRERERERDRWGGGGQQQLLL
jgi:hypothetical protein